MIVVVDYGMGNLGSIRNMLSRLRVEARVSSSPEDVASADKLVVPGVGAFDEGMRKLAGSGLAPVLQEQVVDHGVPVLGICLGMQLFGHGSEEGTRPGLGWIEAKTVRLGSDGPSPLPVPHMGWGLLDIRRRHPLLENLGEGPRFYFAHSYVVSCSEPDDVLATTMYGQEFPAVLARANVVGTQFHPEKSHTFGLAILRNFAGWSPRLP